MYFLQFLLICGCIVFLFSCSNLSVQALKSSEDNKIDSSNYESSYCMLNLIPDNYDIHIHPIKLLNNITGRVKIRATIGSTNCSEDANGTAIAINFHGLNVFLENVTVTNLGNGQFLQIFSQFYQEKHPDHSNDFFSGQAKYIIHLQHTLNQNDRVEIFIGYEIKLTSDDSISLNHLSKKSHPGVGYSCSQNFDRLCLYKLSDYAFPKLLHEISHKATFQFHVSRSLAQGYVTIANTEILETTPILGQDGWVVDHFRTTPELFPEQITVIYLRDLHNTTAFDHSQNHTEIKRATVWTVENTTEVSDMAMTFAKYASKQMQFYGKLLNTTNILDKLDFVQVPRNLKNAIYFVSGIVFISKPDLPTLKEMGNGVEWMDIGNQKITDLIVIQQIIALIKTPKVHTQDGTNIIDVDVLTWVINYLTKSTCPNRASVLARLEDALSRQIMRTALFDNLLQNENRTVTSFSDFVAAFEEAVLFYNATRYLPQSNNKSLSVGDILNSWRGYDATIRSPPLFKIQVVENYTNSIAISINNCYTKLGWVPIKILSETDQDMRWVNICKETNGNNMVVMSSDVIDARNWFIINPEGKSYYEVSYDFSIFKNIVTQLNSNYTVIPTPARNNLLKGQIKDWHATKNWESIQVLLNWWKYLMTEPDCTIWSTTISLSHTPDKVENGEPLHSLTKYFGYSMNEKLKQIGMIPITGENESCDVLRLQIMKLSGSYEIPICGNFSAQLIHKWIQTPENNPLEPRHKYLKGSLYCAAVRWEGLSSRGIFDFLVDQLTNLTYEEGKDDYFEDWEKPAMQFVQGMLCTKNDDLLLELLNSTEVEKKPEYLQELYRQVIPEKIYKSRSKTMTKHVFDFWMRELLSETISSQFFFWGVKELAYLDTSWRQKTVQKVVELVDENIPTRLVKRWVEVKNLLMTNTSAQSATSFSQADRKKLAEWVNQNMST